MHWVTNCHLIDKYLCRDIFRHGRSGCGTVGGALKKVVIKMFIKMVFKKRTQLGSRNNRFIGRRNLRHIFKRNAALLKTGSNLKT